MRLILQRLPDPKWLLPGIYDQVTEDASTSTVASLTFKNHYITLFRFQALFIWFSIIGVNCKNPKTVPIVSRHSRPSALFSHCQVFQFRVLGLRFADLPLPQTTHSFEKLRCYPELALHLQPQTSNPDPQALLKAPSQRSPCEVLAPRRGPSVPGILKGLRLSKL